METATLADRLRYQRKKKGWSQEELSLRTQVTVRTIQRIENAEVNPHLKTVTLLATALEIEVEDLLVLHDPKQETLLLKWLLLLHATPLLGLVLPLSNILIPLFLWIHKRDDNPKYWEHGAKVVNFQISFLIYAIISFGLFMFMGYRLFLFLIPIWVAIILLNIGMVIKKGRCFYPMAIPFLMGQSKKPPTQVLSAVLLLLCLGGYGQSEKHMERLDESRITKNSVEPRIERLMQQAQVTGLGITLFDQNTPVLQEVWGYADLEKGIPLKKDHVFYAASLSKSVFAYIVAQMVLDGKLDLDRPVYTYFDVPLPDLPISQDFRKLSDLHGDERYKKITLRMCLSHTTGFPNWRWLDNKARKLRILFEPGTHHAYSGEGFMLAQWVVEYVAQKPLEVLARELVFEPLQMEQTDYLWQKRFEGNFCYGHDKAQEKLPKDIELDDAAAAGSMETTLKDYSKFLGHVLRLASARSELTNLLFHPNIKIRTQAQFGPLAAKQTDAYDTLSLSYGLGWALIDTPYGMAALRGGHSEGFQHYSILFPEQGKGMLIMSNSDNAEGIFKELLELLLGDTFTPWQWKGYIPYNVKS
ncbi:serine hydrolase [Sediminicola luteus]|uniref:HTH cro/C1-type domain-containing protein n=1 Tax=Sediminicola luteus TaxID=319238 RepID=A0A2A4G2T4_9FLAO|nr:serine hydrolase [Sediminicola luteus]PCE62723.1 hypothetical protein B7P33_15630 [Sediminicola luteus]